MKKIQNIISKIEGIAAKKGDFTIDTSFKPIAEGYIVASKHTQNSFGRDGLVKVIALVFWQNLEEFDGIGGWLNEDNGLYYWDAVKVFTNEKEALQYASDNNQIAYFDAYKNEVKKTKYPREHYAIKN